MFIVIELQANGDAPLGNIVTPCDTWEQAQATYHQILAAAAISKVPKHSATILRDDGFQLEYVCYEHPSNDA